MKIADIMFDEPAVPAAVQSEERPAGACLEDLFRAAMASCPDGEALAGGEQSLSFAELVAFSARIAAFVSSQDYGEEAVVGVLCRRGALYLAAAFGVMRAGAVYLPVEHDLPLARQEAMLRPAKLIITDQACLREAEYFLYRNPATRHVLCLDALDCRDVADTETGLSSTAYWEHVAEAGPDQGWRGDVDGRPYPAWALSAMAASLLERGGLVASSGRRVLDIGSGSGTVARALAGAAGHYAAVELARNELNRVVQLEAAAATVRPIQIEAVDIGFLDGERFDLVVLNGVVENFPSYNYLRQVLDHAVARLEEGGAILLGAVRDLDRKDDLRAALKAHAQASGDHSGLLRLDSAPELFVPKAFFDVWAAESPVAVEVSFPPATPEMGDLAAYRFDVTIRKSLRQTPASPVLFGTRHLPSDPGAAFPACRPEQAAYIVYTSGSTGRPKGIVVEHRHLLHIVNALKPYSEDCQRVALVAPLSFDASIQQIAVSLLCGKPLYVMSDEERKDPRLFRDAVLRQRIDLCDMTPAFFNVLVDHLFERGESLPIKRILLAGEVLRPDMVAKFYAIAGHEDVVLFNVYGPTECTVDSSAFRIDFSNYRAFPAYPIGKPLDGCVISIRDRNGQRLPDSVTGELWISGKGVSRGYLNGENPESFAVLEEGRFYKTGDRGFTLNGLVYYQGREDQQVKIRGNRVEIGEVEEAVAGFPGVRQVAVLADVFRAGEEKSLAAYIVGTFDAAALRGYLEQHLPPYCVPAYFVPMVELPLSANRKVDKKSLPPPLIRATPTRGRRPAGEVEEKLAVLWQRLLGAEVTDAEASFFSLGGHSIMAIRLIAMIEKEMNVHVSLNDLFAHPSIAQLASFFADHAGGQDSPVIKLCHCEGGKTIFMFHPVGGSVVCYSDLAALLGGRYTVYAVEAAGFRPERTSLNTEFHRVEGLAEYYLGEILKVEARDVIFGGWSFGGLLAYEVACRYEKKGRKAGPVIILDTVADTSRAKQIAAKDDVEFLKTLLHDGIAFDETELRTLPRQEWSAYLVACGEKSGVLPFGFSTVQMDNLLQTYRGNAIANARYDRPTHSDKKILFLRALDFIGNPQIILDDPYQGWSRFLKEENITLEWTEGTHETMLSPGRVEGVAAHILDYLDRA